jgi:hypothetical protein
LPIHTVKEHTNPGRRYPVLRVNVLNFCSLRGISQEYFGQGGIKVIARKGAIKIRMTVHRVIGWGGALSRRKPGFEFPVGTPIKSMS